MHIYAIISSYPFKMKRAVAQARQPRHDLKYNSEMMTLKGHTAQFDCVARLHHHIFLFYQNEKTCEN